MWFDASRLYLSGTGADNIQSKASDTLDAVSGNVQPKGLTHFMAFGDEQRTAGCPCVFSFYRCCLGERLTGWLRWQLDSCSYRCSHRSMPWRWGWGGGVGGGAVCLVYLYEVPRTCIAVSFSNGAWAWIRKDGTEEEYREKAQMGNYQTRLTLFEEAPITKQTKKRKRVFFFSKFVISLSINEQSNWQHWHKSKHFIWSTRSVWATRF